MIRTLSALCLVFVCATVAVAHDDLPTKAEVKALSDQGAAWLLKQQQADGSFLPGDQFKLGITTVAVNALLDAGLAKDDPRIVKAADFIAGFIQDDGGIYNPQEGLGVYGTSLGLRVLLRTDKAPEKVITGAQNYLLGNQNLNEDSVSYGGIGYGRRGEGNEDMSNTSMALEALHESGLPKDHPGMVAAMKFVTRSQNLSSHNDQPWAGNDGGGVYSPDSSMALGSFRDGQGLAEKPTEGSGGAEKLNSYGSMTYALITSYIYLDLDKEDPRLKAAMNWVRNNYQFDRNPGMPEKQQREGLFYYYQAMAKTFDLMEAGELEIGDGHKDWRADLFGAIKERAIMAKDADTGAEMALWINDQPRWAEGIPHLGTAYMLTALYRIHKSLPE